MKNPLIDKDVKELLMVALSINDKLKINVDHVEFTGSMNDAELFKEIVNRCWHKSCGWIA